jgi:hypothetical protein
MICHHQTIYVQRRDGKFGRGKAGKLRKYHFAMISLIFFLSFDLVTCKGMTNDILEFFLVFI